MKKILVIDDEKLIRWSLKKDLEQLGYIVTPCESAEEALPLIEATFFHAALVDARLPGMSGPEFLLKLKQASPDTQVIMITAFADVETAVSSIRNGAFDFLLKPFTLEKIRLTLNNALEFSKIQNELSSLKAERSRRLSRKSLLGQSSRMQKVIADIEKVGKAGAGVILLCGESGTGKGVAAAELHQLGPRSTAPFIEINCGAIPENLFESELFGHEKGAFTGASDLKKGLMEIADGGTLFLDEVGEMPLTIQTKFLKALEEQNIRRIGGNRPIQVDFHLIAATNRDLTQAVREGQFREDLFYRLNVVPIFLPPLRDRADDIVFLASRFLEQNMTKYRRSFNGFSEEAKRRMLSYHWPGNIRELKNCIERAVILENGDRIEEATMGIGFTDVGTKPPALDIQKGNGDLPPEGFNLHEHLESIERRFLQQALETSKGNQSQAAKLLGMTRDILRYRLKKYDLGES